MKRIVSFLLCAFLLLGLCCADTADYSPAVYVVQKTEGSVVGVLASITSWTESEGTVVTPASQGSGVVVREGGYILTNYHVISDCDTYEILQPNGEYADAVLVGSDSTLDIAVLQCDSELLKVCEIGSAADLLVGSTVVAIGNPGGEVLANTVTQGIVSALERDVQGSNTKRAVKYIQHDAAINSGNSGGGLFDYLGRLVGINTLKYSGSVYSSVRFEGLGFALPIDDLMPLVDQIITYGKVIRAQMGVYTLDWNGPDEPLNNYPPASVLIADLVEDAPAANAGVQLYDFLVEVDGVRITCYRELSTELDRHEGGDTVHVKFLRYSNIEAFLQYVYYGTMPGFGFSVPVPEGYEEIELDITLEYLDLK